MPEIIYLSIFNTCYTEVAIDCSPDVADQERIASFGDKKGGIFGFWATGDVLFNSIYCS